MQISFIINPTKTASWDYQEKIYYVWSSVWVIYYFFLNSADSNKEGIIFVRVKQIRIIL